MSELHSPELEVPLPHVHAGVQEQGLTVFLLAATLRTETTYGQTNCWVLPGGQYGVYRGRAMQPTSWPPDPPASTATRSVCTGGCLVASSQRFACCRSAGAACTLSQVQLKAYPHARQVHACTGRSSI